MGQSDEQNQTNTLYDHIISDREDVARWTDSYFTNAKDCVRADGDVIVTYAVFQRTPVIFAPDLALGWLGALAKKENVEVICESSYEAGDKVRAGEPSLYVTGPLSFLAECETFFLQKMGATQVAALNAYNCAMALPKVGFIAMGARHCAGTEMQEMMDYAASIGSRAAQEEGAKGFVNGASHATSHFFGQEYGVGTMPHVLVGYYGSTLKAAQAFRREHSDKPFVVLNDFNGQEITDALEVCRAFPDEAGSGVLGFRLDTNGARYLEGMDHDSSIETIHRHAPHMMEVEMTEAQLKVLYGQGVSIASIFRFREALDEAGYNKVRILASSGFNPQKCELMAMAGAPLDGVGTGSYIPKDFHATYATADVFKYGEEIRVKAGREYLVDRYSDVKRLPF